MAFKKTIAQRWLEALLFLVLSAVLVYVCDDSTYKVMVLFYLLVISFKLDVT